jgi:hypothetical protein
VGHPLDALRELFADEIETDVGRVGAHATTPVLTRVPQPIR